MDFRGTNQQRDSDDSQPHASQLPEVCSPAINPKSLSPIVDLASSTLVQQQDPGGFSFPTATASPVSNTIGGPIENCRPENVVIRDCEMPAQKDLHYYAASDYPANEVAAKYAPYASAGSATPPVYANRAESSRPSRESPAASPASAADLSTPAKPQPVVNKISNFLPNDNSFPAPGEYENIHDHHDPSAIPTQMLLQPEEFRK